MRHPAYVMVVADAGERFPPAGCFTVLPAGALRFLAARSACDGADAPASTLRSTERREEQWEALAPNATPWVGACQATVLLLHSSAFQLRGRDVSHASIIIQRSQVIIAGSERSRRQITWVRHR